MATSSKVQFKLETLREKALESIDTRIAAKEADIAGIGDEDSLTEERRVWRARQEARISELFSRLGGEELSDLQLSEFKLDKLPKLDPWESQSLNRELRALRALRTQVLAKTASLIGDEDGNIALTSRQLEEFFGL